MNFSLFKFFRQYNFSFSAKHIARLKHTNYSFMYCFSIPHETTAPFNALLHTNIQTTKNATELHLLLDSCHLTSISVFVCDTFHSTRDECHQCKWGKSSVKVSRWSKVKPAAAAAAVRLPDLARCVCRENKDVDWMVSWTFSTSSFHMFLDWYNNPNVGPKVSIWSFIAFWTYFDLFSQLVNYSLMY